MKKRGTPAGKPVKLITVIDFEAQLAKLDVATRIQRRAANKTRVKFVKRSGK